MSPETATSGRAAIDAGTANAGPGLHSGFLRSVERVPDRPALSLGEDELSYRELHRRAAAVAATLDAHAPAEAPPLVAIYCHRTITAFSGVLGVLMSGRGYVPLNPSLPDARNRLMLERSGARAIVVDPASAGDLGGVIEGLGEGCSWWPPTARTSRGSTATP